MKGDKRFIELIWTNKYDKIRMEGDTLLKSSKCTK